MLDKASSLAMGQTLQGRYASTISRNLVVRDEKLEKWESKKRKTERWKKKNRKKQVCSDHNMGCEYIWARYAI